MALSYSGGLIVSVLLMTVLIALPVKLAAIFAGAQRTGIVWCGLAVVVGMVTGSVASFVFGGFVGGPLAGFLGFVLGMRIMLGTSYVAALGLSVIAFGLSMLGLTILVRLGIIVTGPAHGLMTT